MDLAPDEFAIGSLRRATTVRHHLLESVLTLGDPLELGGYIDAMRGFELFLARWEPRVRAGLPARLHDWLASRSRHKLACLDLAQFGCEPSCDSGVTAACASLVDDIELHSTAAAFGSIYVLEGSALGGQVIAKAASETLGLGPENGAAYFNGFRLETALRWREFQLLLEVEVGSRPEARQDACKAAKQTFDALIGIFTMLRHGPVST